VTDVGHLYDWLSRYVQLANWLAYRDRFAGFTMHKPLGEGGVQTVNERLLAIANLPPDPRVLDAGCGFGGTIFAWHARVGGSYDGLTLSRVQTRVATREAKKRGIDARFHLRSFDEPIEGKYDAVIAIETLIHAPDLARTIRNLTSALAPGGKLLIVDDVASGEVPPHDAELLATHWSCPRLYTMDDYRRAGLTLAEDLTEGVRTRDPETLAKVERKYARMYRLAPIAPARAVLSAYLGGIAIERLYALGLMRYTVWSADSPAILSGLEGAPVKMR
jgi:SAM-dependent methyltransferase